MEAIPGQYDVTVKATVNLRHSGQVHPGWVEINLEFRADVTEPAGGER